jgi:hypothetical protein
MSRMRSFSALEPPLLHNHWSLKLRFKLNYYLQSVGQSALVSGSHLEPMTRFLFYVWQLRISCCGAPSLTRGWVYNLLVQLLLGLARAVTLGSKSRRTQTIFYSHLRLHQPGGPGPRIYIPQKQGGLVIPPDTGFPFHRLLRLAGPRWRYSNPPSHGWATGLWMIKGFIYANYEESSWTRGCHTDLKTEWRFIRHIFSCVEKITFNSYANFK